jgi:hypothetical protein
MNAHKVIAAIGLTIIVLGSSANAEEVRWVPAAASVDGQFGTSWSTDVWVHNLAVDQTITVHISLYSRQDGAAPTEEVAVEVPRTTSLVIHNVVGDLLGAAGSGALRLRSEHPFEARTRTYNDGGDAGSFGQGIPAVDPEDAMPFGALVGAANLVGPAGVRTNLGILNPGETPTEVLVFLMRSVDNAEADFLTMFSVELGPRGWMQGNLFELAGFADEDIDNAYAIVVGDHNPLDPVTPIFSYLSRIDNRSGDAVYVEPFLNLRYAAVAPEATVRYSLGSTGDFSPYLVSFPGPEGEVQTVLQPSADWSTEVVVDGNQILCFEVVGHVPEGGMGTADACLEYHVPDSGSGSMCRYCGPEAGEVCQLEICSFVY